MEQSKQDYKYGILTIGVGFWQRFAFAASILWRGEYTLLMRTEDFVEEYEAPSTTCIYVGDGDEPSG